ncbi:uncharacterized protein LOC119384799 [Rhipicephalus sanguineus]|uniref:uncharacterized protein LOC119384799 n=1 Tax=Rhipicephalus sanguineus TaxID=34632 RepID=UPI001893B1D4|nr:uncharacterized protein LOC119384799 [Rhipicephalus sanguineus]
MASASHGLLQPPQQDFDNASEWPAWIQTFDDYRYASGLNERSEEAQVRALLYTMGRQARDIFSTFHLSEDDAKKFDVVKKRFDEYFVKDRNVVHESARFHRRQQMPGGTVDHFMTALHVLADRCDFGDSEERLVRDRFVVGLRDEKLSEARQMDGKLNLATALAKARLKETVQMQQEELGGPEGAGNASLFQECGELGVNAVGHQRSQQKIVTGNQGSRSIFCGGRYHARTACTAKAQKCHNCGIKNHFSKACLKKASQRRQVLRDLVRKVPELPNLCVGNVRFERMAQLHTQLSSQQTSLSVPLRT